MANEKRQNQDACAKGSPPSATISRYYLSLAPVTTLSASPFRISGVVISAAAAAAPAPLLLPAPAARLNEAVPLHIASRLIIQCAMDPILHHGRYLFCFNNSVENLVIAKEKLELTQDRVKKQVTDATDRTEIIEPIVENWLKEVENVLQEVNMLEGKISEVRKSCFRKQCQYFLVKEIARKTEKMKELDLNSKFEPFSRITELPGMQYYSSKDFIFFESTKSAYNKILEKVKDENVSMIGLYGIGGSGKTTLAKEVGKKIEELKLFEKVVMTSVSQTLSVRSIQAQMADKLGVHFWEESDEGRAQRLSQRLKNVTTLIILDDVWQKLNFEEIGIPIHENKGCRVLLTTRNKEVCTLMQCQSIIGLDLLTSREAWSLFKIHAKIDDESPYALKFVARKIVDECKGLPIAIVTVGSSLWDKSFDEWELALSKLEDSKPLHIPPGLTSPYICLKLSFDNLGNGLSKSLLLLCSIFPEDYEIHLEDLFRFGKGLGLIGSFGTMEIARKEMHAAVNILKNSCLLIHDSERERVKMHDMVRDVALWIASLTGQAILVRTKMDVRMLVEEENIKDKKVISLWDVNNGQFLDNQLNCPQLETLLLHSTMVYFEVPNACLERLEMLKILAFLTVDYRWEWYSMRPRFSLPQSIDSLQNIHTLCLRGYELGDISILESLQALEILDLRGSSFKELPSTIIKLKKLKLLDLYGCSIEENNAYKVIGCLQLEELYLHLIEYEENFPHNVSFTKLQRYVILLEEDISNWKSSGDKPSRALSVNGFNASAQSFISLPIKDLFLRAEYLDLNNLKGGYKNLIPCMDPQGMNQLIVLKLNTCLEMECLFDNTNVGLLHTQVVFANLVELVLYDMDSLRGVFHDYFSQCFPKNGEEIEEGNVSDQNHTNLTLSKLRRLEIVGCNKLEFIFPVDFAKGLVSLNDLKISVCSELKYVFGTENKYHHSIYQQESLRQANIDLKFLNLNTLWLHALPNLIDICPEYCRPCLPNLKDLHCYSCPKLSNLSVRKVMTDSTLQQDPVAMEKEILCPVTTTYNQLCGQMESPNLKIVKQFRMLNLSDLGAKGVFQFHIGEGGSNRELVYFNLDLIHIMLYCLPELQFIWKGPKSFLCLQQLGHISVGGCPKLKAIFSPTIVRSFPMLHSLIVFFCGELEQIFDSSDAPEDNSLDTCSQKPCFPQLMWISLYGCNQLKCLFHNFVASHFPLLKRLEIEDCSQIEKVFGFDDDVEEGNNKDGQQSLLQKLEYIRLERLPSLKEIHHEFKLKDHVRQYVTDCPKYAPSLYLQSGDEPQEEEIQDEGFEILDALIPLYLPLLLALHTTDQLRSDASKANSPVEQGAQQIHQRCSRSWPTGKSIDLNNTC
ncbi:hypothetical protein Fmac_017174 [Flemingia macrophylla]|uniref:AAA+ ATPase domain-containing protein n=1 Tax=Flemingia macrophylla TaxID=520843 RepID=A0ABD1M1C6_9FABA